jgi:putative Holliday junction resolvase
MNSTDGGHDTRILGLDVGDRWIGVALSDQNGVLASPLAVLDRKDASGQAQAIVDIVDQRGVGRIVVGLPRSMNGAVGAQAEKVKEFVGSLAVRTDVPIEFRDERLSTVSARHIMRDSPTRKTRNKTRDDDIAAAIILQSYLDEES